MTCNYGCGQEAKHQLKNGRMCCSKSWQSCPEIKKKTGHSQTEETRQKMRKPKSNTEKMGRYKRTEETRKKLSELAKKQCLNGHSNHMNSLPKKGYKNHREWMLNEGASYCNSFPVMGYKNNKEWMENTGPAYTNSFLKNPSRSQVSLWMLACSILPNPILNFPFYREKGKKSYSLDIADPRIGIVIEYDGYFHFDTEEHKQYHKKRQKEIEKEGWKFIRYNIFQKFPTKEQVLEDIERTIKGDK